MRAYIVVTGALFALVTALHVWRLIEEWSGFDSGFWTLLTTMALSSALAFWAWRLFMGLNRQE